MRRLDSAAGLSEAGYKRAPSQSPPCADWTPPPGSLSPAGAAIVWRTADLSEAGYKRRPLPKSTLRRLDSGVRVA